MRAAWLLVLLAVPAVAAVPRTERPDLDELGRAEDGPRGGLHFSFTAGPGVITGRAINGRFPYSRVGLDLGFQLGGWASRHLVVYADLQLAGSSGIRPEGFWNGEFQYTGVAHAGFGLRTSLGAGVDWNAAALLPESLAAVLELGPQAGVGFTAWRFDNDWAFGVPSFQLGAFARYRVTRTLAVGVQLRTMPTHWTETDATNGGEPIAFNASLQLAWAW